MFKIQNIDRTLILTAVENIQSTVLKLDRLPMFFINIIIIIFASDLLFLFLNILFLCL